MTIVSHHYSHYKDTHTFSFNCFFTNYFTVNTSSKHSILSFLYNLTVACRDVSSATQDPNPALGALAPPLDHQGIPYKFPFPNSKLQVELVTSLGRQSQVGLHQPCSMCHGPSHLIHPLNVGSLTPGLLLPTTPFSYF